MRSRISWLVRGRPGRFGYVRLRVIRWRCQASSVPCLTSRWARSAAGSSRASAARTARSAQSGDLTPQHRDLMTEHHDLRILDASLRPSSHQPAKDPDHDQVEQAKGHKPRSCRNQLVRPIRRSQYLRRVLKRYRLLAACRQAANCRISRHARCYSQHSPFARSSSPGYSVSFASRAGMIRPVSALVRR